MDIADGDEDSDAEDYNQEVEPNGTRTARCGARTSDEYGRNMPYSKYPQDCT